MKAAVFHKTGKIQADDMPDPRIGIRMSFGQTPAQKHMDELIGVLDRGEIKLNDIITHRLPLAQAPDAYKIFRDKEDNCVKVVLNP